MQIISILVTNVGIQNLHVCRFRDISGLKMVLLRELGAIESGRKDLLERLTGLDAGLDNPDPLDVERAGHCSRCQPDMKGPICAHCEAEELFQVTFDSLHTAIDLEEDLL